MRPTQKRSVACAIGRIMKLTTAGSASDAIRRSSSSPKRQAACGGGGAPAAANRGAALRLCMDGTLRLSAGPATAGSSASVHAGSSSVRSGRRCLAIARSSLGLERRSEPTEDRRGFSTDLQQPTGGNKRTNARIMEEEEEQKGVINV